MTGPRKQTPDPNSAASRIKAYLLRHYPCQELPKGALTEVAAKFGVSRELVRQQAVKLGMVTVYGGKPKPVCMRCGAEMPYSKSPAPLCNACRVIEIECANCGKLLPRSAARMATTVSYGRYKGRVFCDRQCLGVFSGRNYGFTAHPENAKSKVKPIETHRWKPVRRTLKQGECYFCKAPIEVGSTSLWHIRPYVKAHHGCLAKQTKAPQLAEALSHTNRGGS